MSNGEEVGIATDPGDQVNPHISQEWVVWSDNGWFYEKYDVNCCDLRDMLPFTIADAGLNPSIYNDLIVWEDWRNGNGDIYAYNLSTGEEKQVTRESSDQGNPVIYENYVAYLDDREGSPQVWMINLDTRAGMAS